MSPMRGRRQSGFRWGRPALAGLATATLVAGLAQVSGGGASGRATPSMLLSASERAVGARAIVPLGTRLIGPAPAKSSLHFDVVLSPRNPAALTRFATEVSTPGTPEYFERMSDRLTDAEPLNTVGGSVGPDPQQRLRGTGRRYGGCIRLRLE